jgi:hypothetical protein
MESTSIVQTENVQLNRHENHHHHNDCSSQLDVACRDTPLLTRRARAQYSQRFEDDSAEINCKVICLPVFPRSAAHVQFSPELFRGRERVNTSAKHYNLRCDEPSERGIFSYRSCIKIAGEDGDAWMLSKWSQASPEFPRFLFSSFYFKPSPQTAYVPSCLGLVH